MKLTENVLYAVDTYGVYGVCVCVSAYCYKSENSVANLNLDYAYILKCLRAFITLQYAMWISQINSTLKSACTTELYSDSGRSSENLCAAHLEFLALAEQNKNKCYKQHEQQQQQQ